MLFIVSLLLCACMSYSAHRPNDNVFDVFDVKPEDKALYYQKKWQKYKCTFIYHAHGQTKEQWRLIMQKMDGTPTYLKCIIFRTESYLTFENFTMSLTGPGVNIVKQECTSISDVPLKDSETSLDRPKGTVSSVEGKFRKKLASILLMAKLEQEGKTEL